MARKRRIAELAGGEPPGPASLFGPDDDNVIPGEVVLALEADAAAEITVSIPSMPDRVRSTLTVTEELGGHLDNVLAELDVQSVTRVHGPSPTRVVNGLAVADDLGLDTTLRVRYAADQAPSQVAERLASLDAVSWAEPNRWRETTVVPNDPRFGSQWGLTRINCPDAWDLTTGDPSVVVAVVDSGVDLNHPELAALLLSGQDLVDFAPGSIPKLGWVFEGDFTGVDPDPQDENGHGTHVAGTICCASNNAAGVAGVAWNVRLLPVRVMVRIRETATGQVRGIGSGVTIAAGIRWAVDNGARVINLSLGGYEETTVEREAVAYAISRGVVVVASMGNDNSGEAHYPSAFPDVIAVAATDSADRRASFSNFGPWVDVSAPGVGVVSTYWDDTYAALSGTSMATPHVTGVAALVLSRNSSLTVAEVGNILRSTARPLRDAPDDPIPNDRYGAGLVQAAAAVRAAAPVVPRQQQSRQILCQPSELCPSVAPDVLCTSLQIACQPSVRIVCNSTPIACPSTLLRCRSLTVVCPVSRVIGCRSIAECPSLRCWESLRCEPGGGEPVEGMAAWEAYDPYGYDPYGSDYA
jgi:subtilisin family serine protease